MLEEFPDLQVLGEAGDGREAVELARRLRPDVVILDIRMPHVTGIDAAKQIMETAPGTKVLILSAHNEPDYVSAAINAGVSGYLLKTARMRDLAKAVRSVHAGEIVLDPAISFSLAKMWPRRPHPVNDGLVDPLTEREIEVLRLIARGMRNRDIAQQLNLSVRTVEGYASSILCKLGVQSRAGAAMYAASHHLMVEPVEGEAG